MADTQPNIQVVRYLDYEGLQTLWDKISSTYLRQVNVVSSLTEHGEGKIIESEGDTFIQRKYFNEANTELWEKIEEIISSQGQNIDHDTIINVGGVMKTNLVLHNDSTNHVLSIVTERQDGTPGTVVSEWDYDDFYKEAVKDGILHNVSLVMVPNGNDDDDNRAPGTYLKFEFNTDSGTEPIYVDVDDLVDVYTEGSYIKIEKTNNLDGDEGNVTISVDKVALVNDLKSEDVFGITSIITRIDTLESDLGNLETVVSGIQTFLDELNLLGWIEQIEDNTAAITNIQEVLKTVPTVPITVEEINGLE